MKVIFQILIFFVSSILGVQAWSLVAQSDVSYQYDQSSFKEVVQNHGYDSPSNFTEKAKLQSSFFQLSADRFAFVFSDGFIATKSVPKSLKDQAADLIPQNANKHRVTLRSPSQKMEVDLAGKAHGGIPTPHTKVSPRNYKAPNQPAYNTKNAPVRDATQQDIRTVRRYLERQGR